MADEKIWIGTDSGNEGDINTAANWSPAGVPVATDHVTFQDSSQDITDGLATWAAVALGSVHFKRTFTGAIDDGVGGYLQFLTTNLDINEHYGTSPAVGSGDLLIDIGTTAAVVVIHYTKSSASVKLKCNNAATTIEVKKGNVSIADGAGETSTVGTITINYTSNILKDANVTIGSGVTLTTLNKLGSIAYLKCAATTILNEAGDLTTMGSGAYTTLNAYGGTVFSNSSGVVGTTNISKATVDTTQSRTARTFTTVNRKAGGIFIHDDDIITLTNAIVHDRAAKVMDAT